MPELAKTSIIDTMNQFYIETIQDSARIDSETPEKKNLYLTAFFGLMRNGHKYRVLEEQPKKTQPIIVEDSEKKKKKKKQDDESIAALMEDTDPIRYIVMTLNGVVYKCPELDLKYAFSSMYDKVVETTSVKKKKRKLIDDDDFFLPDVYANDEPEETTTEIALDRHATANVQPLKKNITLPYIGINPKYDNDEVDNKTYDSFLFNMHTSKVRFKNGEEKDYQFVIYPLYPDTDDNPSADVMVIATDEDRRTRAVLSDPAEGRQKSVSIEFEEITFIVRAYWEDETFITSVSVLSTPTGESPILRDKCRSCLPTKRTSTFYLRHIGMNGDVLNIFPTELLRNDASTGLAHVVFMLEDGQERKVYIPGDDSYVSLFFSEQHIHAGAYWVGNMLSVEINVENE